MSINPLSGSTVEPEEEQTLRQPSPGTDVSPIYILLGIAVLGLLTVSIWDLGGFTQNQHIFYQRNPHGGNYGLLTAVSLLFEGKMLALFALAFGAGTILFLTKPEEVGLTQADAYIRRQLWLLLFGIVIAFLLLWPAEILYPVGVVGILLFGFWRFSARGLVITSLVFLLIFVGKQFWNYQDDRKDYSKFNAVTLVEKRIKQDSTTRAKKDSSLRSGDTSLLKNELAKNKIADSLAKKNDTLTKKQKEEKGKWEGIVKSTKYDSAKTASLNKAMQAGSYQKVWNRVMRQSQDRESMWLYRIGLWEIGSMMLLGMALLKWGFFSVSFPSRNHLLLAALGLILGVALAWYRLHYNNVRLGDYEAFVKNNNTPYNLFVPVENLSMAVGYASVIMLLVRLTVFTWVGRVITSVGSMALSNYFIQCITCSIFFYGWGLGYFGKLEQWELYFMVLELTMLQVIFSILWTRYYILGPVEWLWSCLIYRRWLPIRRLSSQPNSDSAISVLS